MALEEKICRKELSRWQGKHFFEHKRRGVNSGSIAYPILIHFIWCYRFRIWRTIIFEVIVLYATICLVYLHIPLSLVNLSTRGQSGFGYLSSCLMWLHKYMSQPICWANFLGLELRGRSNITVWRYLLLLSRVCSITSIPKCQPICWANYLALELRGRCNKTVWRYLFLLLSTVCSITSIPKCCTNWYTCNYTETISK